MLAATSASTESGSARHPAEGPRRGDELGEEHRIAGRPFREQLDVVIGDRRVVRGFTHERDDVIEREWSELEPDHVGFGGRQPRRSVAPGHENEPRTRGEVCRDRLDELGRRVVDPLSVLDYQERGRVEEVSEHLAQYGSEARGPELFFEPFGLGRVGHRHVGHDREEWSPRHQVRSDRPHRIAEPTRI